MKVKPACFPLGLESGWRLGLGSSFLLAGDDHAHFTHRYYATWDNTGMCHLMPQQHLPEWREVDERAFVHRSSWISNKGLDNTMPATVNCICKKSL